MRRFQGIPPKLRNALCNRYTAFALFMVVYTSILQALGGLSSIVFHPLIEGPLLMYLYYLFNKILKPTRWTPYIAALPMVAAYALYDGYFIAFGDVFRIADFHEMPELLQVLPWVPKVLLLTALSAPPLLLILFLDYRKYLRAFAGSMPAILLATNTQVMPEKFLSEFQSIGDEVVWSGAYSVESNGRLAMLLYYEAQRNAAVAKSSTFRDRVQYALDAKNEADTLREHMHPRHVHLVVLESFLDPTLFKNVRYSKNPQHPDFAALFGSKLGYSLSPVFGGGTAQAEFEALCGVPAYSALSSIEFNAFTGAPARCLPDILHQAGFRTIATNAYKPNFFNAVKAYRGVGFGEAYFPSEYAPQRTTYLSASDISNKEDFLFDGPLFTQNAAFVANALRAHPEQPLLNYVLSVYGHFPHYIDTTRRPAVLTMQAKYKDEQLLLAANQHYYRTQAIAAYVKELIRLDPQSLIVLVSDHLPPLDDGTVTYKNLGYLDNIDDSTSYNRIAIIENGVAKKYRTIHHYDIPSLVYNYLTDGWYCQQNACNLFQETHPRRDYFERYMRVMAHAVDQSL